MISPKESDTELAPSLSEANVDEVEMMTTEEARQCIEQINDNLKDTRDLLLELWQREGWKALGYNSWRACVTKEFRGKQAYLYYQLAAAKVERNISTLVENAEDVKIGSIPERHLRPLASLPPHQQPGAYEKAIATAPGGKVTTKHIEEVVRETKMKEVIEEGELKHTETYPVSDAMVFASMAISQLERIRADDSLRKDGIQKVVEWCNKNLN